MPTVKGVVVGGITYGFESEKLQTPVTIDGVQFDGSASVIHYGVCSTAAATAAKTVSITGFSLTTGASIAVRFTNANTSTNPTLNVNGTGAKPVYGTWQAGDVVPFIYDGTVWSASFASSYSNYLYSLPCDTITGDPAATTLGADNVPVKACSVAVTPVISGSGDPSPTNVRSITGWGGAALTINGDTATVDFGQPVYGGTFDVLTGLLTITHGYSVFDGSSDETWFSYAGSRRYYINVPTFTSPAVSLVADIKCDKLKTVIKGSVDGGNYRISGSDASAQQILVYITNSIASVDSLRGWLAANPISVKWLLNTPTTVQLSPRDVATILGANSFGANCGNVTVTLRLDPTLAYNNLATAIVALGGTV